MRNPGLWMVLRWAGPAIFAVTLWPPAPARGEAADSTGIARLRAEVRALKEQVTRLSVSPDSTAAADTLALRPGPTAAPPPRGAAPQQASNLLNPNVSVIGHFQARAGDDLTPGERAFSLREAELGLQAPVDPFARADFFVAVSPDEGVDLEEGYLTFLTLPGGVSVKAGKFRANLGKFNRTHPPETAFADRPLSTVAFFGEEGLSGTGASVSALIPNPWLYLNLDAEVTNVWEGAPAFGESGPDGEIQAGGRKRDLGYLARMGAYLDLGESASLTLGATYATGVHDPAGRSRTHVENFDLTVRWKNPRRAIYRSLVWQTELLLSQRHAADGWARRRGLFSFVDWQCARRWHAGGRFDVTEFPDAPGAERGGLVFLAFAPSEFSRIGVHFRNVRAADGSWTRTGVLKLTFNIGPHGAHPF